MHTKSYQNYYYMLGLR